MTMTTTSTIRNPACTLCRMSQTADMVCDIGFGPPKAKVMVVSKMANSREYQAALEAQLTELGLDVSEIYFTQVIKCKTFEINSTNTEVKRCAAEYLEPEIAMIKPKFILTMGNEALLGTAGKSGITKYRGRVIERADGVKVIPTVSPSAVKRNPGQMPAYLADLRLFVNKVKNRDIGIAEPKYIVGDTKEKFRKILRILDMTEEIDIDIETTGGEYYEPDSKMVSV